MKYDAFISYRHCEPDMEIAKRVHAGLENFKVPSSVQKRSQKSRIRRVFRDQEELPIGSDLSESIATALYNSEFLVVICSPRTMESEWVMKEIDTFISMHGRENILAVLVEGEPWQSFPRQLLTDDYGNVIEPLAADVRGENRRDRKEKLKSELMRLAAPILGCSYDDLRQRHREQKIKKTMGMIAGILGAVAVAGAGFAVYNAMVANRMRQLADEKTLLADEKAALADELTMLNYQLEDSLDAQLINQSSYLAATAESLFNQGNREDAVLVSIEALPSEYNDRPYLPEVEYGLSNYLYAYACGDEIGFDRTLSHDMAVDYLSANASGQYIVTADKVGAVYLWNSDTGERIVKIDAELNSRGNVIKPLAVAVDEEFIYIADENGFRKFDFYGNVMYEVGTGFSVFAAEIYLENGMYVAKDNTKVVIYDTEDGSLKATVENVGDINYGSHISYNSRCGYIVVSHYDFFADHTGISIIDTNNDYSATYVPLNGYDVLNAEVCADGIATVVVNNDFGYDFYSEKKIHVNVVAIDCVSGDTRWSSENEFTLNYTRTLWSNIENRSYDSSEGRINQTVVAIGSTLKAFNRDTGEIMSTCGMSGNITNVLLFGDSSLGIVAQSNGNVDYVDFSNGAIYESSVIITGKSISDIWCNSGKLVIRERDEKDITIMSYHEAYDLETVVEAADGNGGLLSPEENYMVTYGDAGEPGYCFYGVNGEKYKSYDLFCLDYDNYIGFTEDNYFVMVDDVINVVHWYNPIYDSEYTCQLFSTSNNSLTTIGNCYYTRNRRYALYRSGYYYSVVDLITREEIFDSKADSIVTGAAVSEDGSTIYLGFAEDTFCTVDIATGTITEYPDLNLYFANTDKANIVVCDNSRYIAVCCKDAFVRTVDLETRSVTAELEVYSVNDCYLSFLAYTEAVLVHCNDEYINVIYANDGTIYSQISVEVTNIRSLGYDLELDYYIVTADNGVTLLDGTTYKPVACSDKAFGYITSTHTFLLRSGNKIYATKYKNYEELIEEAGRQFPGAELTSEEMMKYNII